MEENNLLPSPVEPEDLFDQVVDGVQDAQEGIPMEHDVESVPESDSVIPSSKDALYALQTLQTYALGRENEYVLGGTFDSTQYQGIIQGRMDQEKYQTKIIDFF